MTIGQFVFAVGLVLLAFAHNLPAAIVLIAVNGWATVAQLMMMNTLIQIDVPDMLRGRVFSVYLWAQQGVAPLEACSSAGWLRLPECHAPLWWGELSACWWWCSAHAKWPVLRQKMANLVINLPLILRLTGIYRHVMMPGMDNDPLQEFPPKTRGTWEQPKNNQI